MPSGSLQCEGDPTAYDRLRRSEVDDLVVTLDALAGHLDDDVVRVLRPTLEPGSREGVPQLGELGAVVDDGRRAGQRHPRAVRAVGDVDARRGLRGDVACLVAVALGDEEHVAVELDLLGRHRVAHEDTVGVRVRQHRDPDVLDQVGDLPGAVVVLAHRVLLVVGVCDAVPGDVPDALEPYSFLSRVGRLVATGQAVEGPVCATSVDSLSDEPPWATSSARVWGMSSPAATVTRATTRTARKTAVEPACTASLDASPPWDAMTAFAMAPKIATPTALPTERMNMLVPVTTARSFHGTEACAAMSVGVATRPRPKPTTRHDAAVAKTFGVAEVSHSARAPTVATTRPMSAVGRKPMRM